MINMYYPRILNVVSGSAMSITDILSGTDIAVNIGVNVIVIIGGILGLNYITKLKEKQVDSAFSYLTRLNVRLLYFQELLIVYKDEIMDCFLPEDCRREISPDRHMLVLKKIQDLSENAKETLEFIKNEDNQMPPKKGWTIKFNLFIKFLIDCEELTENSYFKWMEDEEQEENKNQYYDEVLKNIEELLKMIDEQQIKLEDKIFKKN